MTKDEADTALATAIREHALAYDMLDDGALLLDYAVVSAWQPADPTGETTYDLHYAREMVPTHIARGLFATAVNFLNRTDDDA